MEKPFRDIERDRALQALVTMALEPEFEARFETVSDSDPEDRRSMETDLCTHTKIRPGRRRGEMF